MRKRGDVASINMESSYLHLSLLRITDALLLQEPMSVKQWT